MMQFDLPKEHTSIIKVIGVGGGGSNAVNHMFNEGIKGVDFLVCNTDHQSLDTSPVPTKLALGESLTSGKGAGSIPEVGKNAAIESIDELKKLIETNTSMVFVTAGMGGGTGTGAAPVIARACKDMGVLTVGIVTIPFTFEGKKRRLHADEGLEEMREAVDTLLVIQNDKLREVYGNLTLKQAFAKADDVLATAARGIADLISATGFVNVDMNDVTTVMQDSGVALMGAANAEGDKRAAKAVQAALESPLLNDSNIFGAKDILLNITVGSDDVDLEEFTEITDHIQDAAGIDANVIWGYVVDESMGNQIGVTVIATGFNQDPSNENLNEKRPVKHVLTDEIKEISEPMQTPVQPSTGISFSTPTNTPSAPEEPFIVRKVEPQQPELEEVKAEVTPEPVEETRTPTTEQPLLFETDGIEKEVQPTPEKNTAPKKVVYQLDEEIDVEEPISRGDAQENEENIEEEAPVVENKRPQIQLTPEERQNIAEKRFENIRELTAKMRTPSGITQLEKEPAFKRRELKLNFDAQPKSSNEPNISRYSINNNNELRQNNSFLHDNVD